MTSLVIKQFIKAIELFQEERDFSNIEFETDEPANEDILAKFKVGFRALDTTIDSIEVPSSHADASAPTQWVIKFIKALKTNSIRTEVAKMLLPTEAEYGEIVTLGDNGKRSQAASKTSESGSKILINLLAWYCESNESKTRALSFLKSFVAYLLQGASEEQIKAAKNSIPNFKKLLLNANIVALADTLQTKNDVTSFLSSLAGFVVEWFSKPGAIIEESTIHNFFVISDLKTIIRDIMQEL